MQEISGNSKDSASQPSNSEYERSKKDPGGIWTCFICKLEERYDYKGTNPPFAKHLTYAEDCYIMRDPFSPSNRNKVLVLGGDCSFCQKAVCLECSLFYAKRFCKNCLSKNIEHFPVKLQEILLHPGDNEDSEEDSGGEEKDIA